MLLKHGLPARATIVDTRGHLETASAAMGHVGFTDCESLFAHLISPTTKQVTAIDLSALSL